MSFMPHSHDEEFRVNTPDAEGLNRKLDRRRFLLKTSLGLGALATGSLLGMKGLSGDKSRSLLDSDVNSTEEAMLAAIPHLNLVQTNMRESYITL